MGAVEGNHVGVKGTAGGRGSRWYIAGGESRDGERDTREEEVNKLEGALSPTNERSRKCFGARGTGKNFEGGSGGPMGRFEAAKRHEKMEKRGRIGTTGPGERHPLIARG